jgi:hypothetical protein
MIKLNKVNNFIRKIIITQKNNTPKVFTQRVLLVKIYYFVVGCFFVFLFRGGGIFLLNQAKINNSMFRYYVIYNSLPKDVGMVRYFIMNNLFKKTNNVNLVSYSPADYLDESYRRVELEKSIKEIIIKKIGLSAENDDLVKATKIVGYIIKMTKDADGNELRMQYDNYLEMWNKIITGHYKISSFELSAAYALFANYSGLPTRLVFFKTDDKGKELDLIVAESYIRSKNIWFMVDVSHHQVFVKNLYGDLLNAYDYYQVIMQNRALLSNYFFKDGDDGKEADDIKYNKINELKDQFRFINKKTKIIFSLRKRLDVDIYN